MFFFFKKEKRENDFGYLQTNYEELDGRPATRENLMMVLANVDTMLIRATHCYGQQYTRL